MLKVYGTRASRAGRTLWLCRELGVDFEHVQTHFADGGTKTPDYLRINPNGKIPSIEVDDFRLWESMAINIYLAKKYASPLMPADLEGEALMLQWSFWVMTEIEKPLLGLLLQRFEFPAGPVEKYMRERSPKNAAVEAEAVAALAPGLAVLDRALADREYLLGDRFTLADLNVACVLAWTSLAKVDLAGLPRVSAWLGRCLARPAARG
jgi:glutathione S-transferase